MKKLSLNPLKLDQETIAMLDKRQLTSVLGGINLTPENFGGTSTGCGAGSSTCFA